MTRASLLAALLALAPAATAQTQADIPALRKEAKADPAIKAALDDKAQSAARRHDGPVVPR